MIDRIVETPFVSRVERSGPSSISGYVYKPSDLAMRAVVELAIDGVPVSLGRAEAYRPDLDQEGIGDGRYGFSFVLSPDVVAGGGRAEVYLANLRQTLQPTIDLSIPIGGARMGGGGPGAVEWAGGLCLTGWVASKSEPALVRVRAVIDGEIVVETVADRWRVRSPGAMEVDPAFQIHLPERFADGLTKRVVVTDGTGLPLGGSPIALVAFPDPLERLAADAFGPDLDAVAIRARLFDTLSPSTAPLSDVSHWARRYPLAAPTSGSFRFAVAILGDGSAAASRTNSSLEGEPGLVATATFHSPDGIGFVCDDLLAFVRGAAADCDALIFAPAGARFVPLAASRLAATLKEDEEARLAYGDFTLEHDGVETIVALPAFDYERWLEQGYGALLFAIRPPNAIGLLRSGVSDLYHLALSVIAEPVAAAKSVVHVPGLATALPSPNLDAAIARLAVATRVHLRDRAIKADVHIGQGQILPAIRVIRAVQARPLSLIMVVRGRDEGLSQRLETLRPAIDRAGGELIILDTDHPDDRTRARHDAWRDEGIVVVLRSGIHSPADQLNHAAQVARGEVLGFLDADLVARDDDWLDEMLGRLSEPSTVAVGGQLRGSGGDIRHAGFVLGPGFSAADALTDHHSDEPGPGDQLRVAREPSAISEECLLVRRDAFEAIGGFDDVRFPRYLSAADLCLRLSADGGRIVLTPHLDLVQTAPIGAPHREQFHQRERRDREISALRNRWGETLLDDPAYSPLLGLAGQPFANLACPPRPSHPRRRHIHRPTVLPNAI